MSGYPLEAVLEPMTVNAFDLIVTRRAITGSPAASPASLRKMVERLPMARINEAIGRLQRGDARYRFVLDGPA